MRLPYKAKNRVRITSAFGYRTDPISGETGTFHGGLDLVGLDDKTICAPVNGTCVVSQIVTDKNNRTWEWGNYVVIDGEDGLMYYMCHLSKRLVNIGEKVKVGDPIGTEGSTGYSTGSHCHLEIRNTYGKQINPVSVYETEIRNEVDTVWTVPENPKADLDNEPSEWSREAVEWAVNNGLLKGDEKGDLMLRKTATREQIVTMLHRLYKMLKV